MYNAARMRLYIYMPEVVKLVGSRSDVLAVYKSRNVGVLAEEMRVMTQLLTYGGDARGLNSIFSLCRLYGSRRLVASLRYISG